MRLLPLSTYAFLDALIAKLDADAADDDQPEDARVELRNWARNVRSVRRACRERDALIGAVTADALAKIEPKLRAARDEARDD